MSSHSKHTQAPMASVCIPPAITAASVPLGKCSPLQRGWLSQLGRRKVFVLDRIHVFLLNIFINFAPVFIYVVAKMKDEVFFFMAVNNRGE